MAGNTHRANCANAQHPGCVCSGCGGALHGWQGWVSLADATQQARDDRRYQVESKVEKNRRTGALSLNARNRQAFVDLARLDIADYLSAGPGPLTGGWPMRDAALADPAASSSDLGRVSTLANEIMAKTWPEISAEIDSNVKNERTARDVKKQLADHTWCDLLVTLIRWIEQVDQAVQVLSEKGKRFITRALTEHLSGLSKTLVEVVVGILVDKVWSALAKLLEAHFPLFGEDTLRVLRMLALFTCPSVEDHPEVYRYATRPLLGDARGLISDEIKSQVVTLFTTWWRRRSPGAIE